MSAKSRALNQVRIIGGEWRGRKLAFPDIPGLRPTSDRMRETLFNWLQFEITGATCLDLFAGSGALGFESASRGAASVLMVEKNIQAYQALQKNQSLLQGNNITIAHRDAMTLLHQPERAFDIVFLDPPFQQSSLSTICTLLEQYQWVQAGSLIYLEFGDGQPLELPKHWRIKKTKKAGNVWYYLVNA